MPDYPEQTLNTKFKTISMGLSFHYSGSFNPEASLEAMIEEVKEIAEIYRWEYFVFEEAFHENSQGRAEYNEDIYGICFTPPGC